MYLKDSEMNTSGNSLVTWMDIAEIMQGWAGLYNDKRFNDPEALKATARSYNDVFKEERWTARRFKKAASHAVKSCKFYPKVADVIQADQELGNRDQYNERQDDNTPTAMSEVHRIFFSLPGKLTNKKNPATDYPEFGPTLEELKTMSKPELSKLAKGIGGRGRF